ncbi:hypothetical protein TSOC_011520 [Tetrabaena socialis]|uniref:Ankyrin repeat domain-containing protein n=1 Tax=Tetrabaena socialis TaxID=47790 RepID=A0A2J7ZQE7_9CHLO|nr:hypothetical protein TSOC_011520 [Tetrabaena socialis]|eukprot:PNH02498.1 hypothetical protein TSOC_011520 [Tetrabaena socialis]
MQRERERSKREGPPGPSTLSEAQQQQEGDDSASPDPARAWLPELVQRYARCLSCNEVACALRLVNKAAAAQFRGPQDRTVRLSLPAPHRDFAQRWSGVDATRGLTLKQKWKLVRLTARSGSIANLVVLFAQEDCACYVDEQALEAAAGAGQLEVCRWLRQHGVPLRGRALATTAEGGHRAVCEWLLTGGCPWVDSAAGNAAGGGHVGLMDWLLGTGRDSYAGGLLVGAASGCDLPTLQRLHSTHFTQQLGVYGEYYRAKLMTAAAGSLTADWRAKVEWLEGQGFPRTAHACKVAVKQLDWRGRLQWLRQRGYPLDWEVAWEAAIVGAADALQLVLDSGIALAEDVAEDAACRAACGGHLAVLQVLHARGFNVAAAANAAGARGHLPVLAWLMETQGAALSTNLFCVAAEHGNMELMAWLHEHGCPFDESVFAAAAEAGCEAQLEWLAALGCPMGEDGQPYLRALRIGDLATLHCLQRLGCPWGPALWSEAALAAAARKRRGDEELQARMNGLLLGVRAGGGPAGRASRQQQEGPDSASPDPACVWLPELVQRYARSLSCNEVACALRLVNKAAAAQLRGPQDRTVRLSLPAPHRDFAQRWSGVGATRGLTRQQRCKLVRSTAGSGSIANLEVLLAREDCACYMDEQALVAAAGAGQLEVCRWLRQQDVPLSGDALGAATEGGHWAVCEWLLAGGCPWVNWAAGSAAGGGHVGLMDWLLGTGRGFYAGGLLVGAARGCDLPTLQRLHSTHFTQQLGEYSKEVRAKVEWLEGQGFPRTAHACKEAVKQPDWRDRLQWLRQRGYPLEKNVAWEAASVGAADALQHVLDSGIALNEDAAEDAAGRAAWGGHLVVLQMLHARGFNVAAVANAAAVRGHLPMPAWFLETQGTALSAGLFYVAAVNGSMELMAWLHEHGCPWDRFVFTAAAAAGCEAQLEWLAALGCPMGEDGQPYLRALGTGDLATLRCLQRLGCPWGRMLWSKEALVAVTRKRRGDEELQAWLQQQRLQPHQLPTGDPHVGAGAGSM